MIKKVMALLAALILVVALSVGAGAAGGHPPEPPANHVPVTICHDVNGNGNTGNGYNIITVDADSIVKNGHTAHGGGLFDIIPAFTWFEKVKDGGGNFHWEEHFFPGQGDPTLIDNNCGEQGSSEDTPVTPEVTFNDPCGTENDAVSGVAKEGYTFVTTQDGLVYTTVFTAVEGFKLVGDDTIVTTLTDESCGGGSNDTPITPEVVVTDKCGVKNDSVDGVVKVGYTFETTNVGLQYFTQFTPVEGFEIVGDNPIINVLTDKDCPDTPDKPDTPDNPDSPDNPKTVSHPKSPEDKPEAHKKNGPVAVPTVIDSGL